MEHKTATQPQPRLDNIVFYLSLFLTPLAVGQPANVWPVVHRASVGALTFILNIFFSETTYPILMKFHRNVPAMVLFRLS